MLSLITSRPAPRVRLAVVALLLLAQTALFVRFMVRPPAVVSDNARYEEAGWQLATTGTLRLPFALMADATVRDWVCTRHAEACVDTLYPTASYPPGYQLFVAGVYALVGRSLLTLVALQWLLLLLLFATFEPLAYRLLDGAGYWFALAAALTYPFIARQASWIMSDHLHVVLLGLALAAFVLLRPSLWRGVLFGLLLAAATLTRPYSLVCIVVIFLWPRVWRGARATRGEWLAAALAGALPFVAWALRNAYWFGRFVPLTTTGLGAGLYTLALEWQYRGVYGAEAARAINAAMNRYGDVTTWVPNHKIAADAVAWLRAHPGALVAMLLLHVVKVWVSLGFEGQGVSPAALGLVAYLGALWALGVAGMWLARRDERFAIVYALVLPYWLMVLPFFEARRTLPLRLPMLLFAGVAVGRAVAWWQRRRGQRHEVGRGRARGDAAR